MLFSKLIFIIFFAAVLVLLAAIRSNRYRKFMLLAASYYFYAYWDWRFCGLLLFSTLVDFCVGQGLKHTSRIAQRKLLLVISLVANLGVLGFFKYFNFFIESMQTFLEPCGFHVQTLNIILPVGISFYTFQTLSYTIDVYRKKIQVCDNIFDFALYVGFFPQLVAGPIVRASSLLPQLREYRRLTAERFFLGFRQFIFGMFKKVMFADHLALVSDYVFGNFEVLDGVTVWIGVLAYTGQIYCDFSGYSDMAIGMARMMGYDFDENFDHPYTSTSLTMFWKKWHISLSSWLRDYLYIPLGGNRKGTVRTYINVMVTMVLGGLWHGAAWTFVFWGGIHGIALVIEKRLGVDGRMEGKSPLRRFGGWLYTMLVVIFAWVFFRSQTFADAWGIFSKMLYVPVWNENVLWISARAVIILPLLVVIHYIGGSQYRKWFQLPADKWYTPFILFTLIWIMILFRARGFHPFVYFQF